VQRVAEEPTAIGFASGNISIPGTKGLAIGEREDGYFSTLTPSDVVSGKYPYDRYLYSYLRRAAGASLDSLAREYLRMVLSREGQRAIAAATPRYLPLSAREINEELDKLGR
jgi:phosphate transport system substrate-binding protein